MGNNSGITSWVVLIFLLIYCPLANIVFFTYASSVQSTYNKDLENTAFNTSIDINTSNYERNSNPISFLDAIYIAGVEEMPWYLSLFLIVIPDMLLLFIILMVARGIW